MVRVLAYARVSTEEQTHGQKGRSIAADYTSTDAQVDLITRHCSTLTDATGVPHTVVRAFKDEGYSGKNTDRPALAALIAAVEAREGDMVMIYRLDRISRRVVDFLHLDERFGQFGASILSIREQFDTSTPMGRMIRLILLAFAEMERETTVQRVNDKLTALVASGRWAGGKPPYGWRVAPTGGLEIDPDEAAAVALMFHLYAVEGLSPGRVAAVLNERGIPSSGKRGTWTLWTVKKAMRSPAHRGIQRNGTREGEWPFGQIVPAALVAAADARLNNPPRGGQSTVTWAWKGIGRCGLCGYPMRRDIQPRPAYEYIRCGSRNYRSAGVAACPQPAARMEFANDLSAAVLLAVRGSMPPVRPVAQPDVADALLRIAERRRRAGLSYNAPGSMMRDAEYLAILEECRREEERLQPPAPVDLQSAVTLADAWHNLTPAEQGTALRSLVKSCTWHPDRVDIALHPQGWDRWPDTLPVPRLPPYGRL